MKKLLYLSIIFSSLFIIGRDISFADIDVTVSPVRYDLVMDRGSNATKVIKLYNNTNSSQEIFVTTKNAVGMDDSGQPKFVENIANPYYHLAAWVFPGQTSFIIGPKSNIDIPITIMVPNKATPGGHYGAIFFNVKENGGGQISIQKRIGVLLLLKIPGNVNAEGEITDISIRVRSGGGGGASSTGIKGDLVGGLFRKYILGEKDLDLDLTSAPEKNTTSTNSGDTDFKVDLDLDFSNKGNTHLKPKGKIEIIGEDGKPLKKIGKETIKNEAGAIVGEKVVDYIPINDEDGNVLPNENRKFKQSWDGFAYETLDENGKKIIKYMDPSEYYSTKNKANMGYLMPREKVYRKETNKKLTAKIDLGYTDPNGKDVDVSTTREFDVSYLEDYIGFNRIVVFPGIFILLIIVIFFIVGLRKKKKCPNCKKTVNKDMHICPYCGEHLKKKKHDKD